MTRKQLNAIDYFLLTLFELNMLSWPEQDTIWKTHYKESGFVNDDDYHVDP